MILEALQISYCLANCMLDFSLSLGPSRAVGAWDHLLNNRWLSSLANCACYTLSNSAENWYRIYFVPRFNVCMSDTLRFA